ncbi:MAG: alkaline phosphatase [Clostridiales bacterium]|nr:alkaline phosphatase [Clostridiales bacterium]
MKLSHKISMLALAATMSMSAAQPRYIFYFIGDGMGLGQVMSSQTYNRVALGSDTTLLMTRFPVSGMLETYSATGPVTDSAAAGTALSTGNKTRNGMLGVTPDTTAVTSIASVLHDAGWGVALVTTVAPDDATPGAFYAHVPSRSQHYDIGRQAAESGYEFIAGAWWRGAYDRNGNDTGLFDYMKEHGVDLVTSTDAVGQSNSRRVFLYSENPFSDGDVGYTIDSIPGALNLPDMTTAAIDHMMKVTPDKFFMMVEGGNIDHAAHANDGGAVAVEVLNFDKAIARAYEFYKQHPDETVIVVTADHETGGMSVGNRSLGYKFNAHYIPYQNISKERFSREVKSLLNGKTSDDMTWEQFKEFAAQKTGLWTRVPVKESQEAKLMSLYDETFNKRKELADEKTLYASFNSLANEVFKVLNENQGFGWTTGGHSGNPVPVYAVGEGMEVVGRIMDNTELAPTLLKLAGY